MNPEIIGRYALYEKIASGGMATVHIGRLLGPVGFSRTVAIKRMHAQFTGDPEFVSMFLDEARLAARVRHPNVVSTLDVVATKGELFLVLDYVQGETLSSLVRRVRARDERIPIPVVAAIVSGVLHGLHAAHEATNERGEPLGIVHRDISPQNVMVGIDGVARVLDFGVAKAAGRLQTTQGGTLKGKISYMPPEQVMGQRVTRRCDVYAASVVLWEALTGLRLFEGDSEGTILQKVLALKVERPSTGRPEIPPELDAVVMRGLSRDPAERYATAREMATALEAAVQIAIVPAVGAWVDGVAAESISEQKKRVALIERDSNSSLGEDAPPDHRHSLPSIDISDPSLDGASSRGGAPDGSSTMATSSIRIAGLEPAASARRVAAVGVGIGLVAVLCTALVMRRRAASAPEAADAPPVVTAPLAGAPPSPPGAAIPLAPLTTTDPTASAEESAPPEERAPVKPAGSSRHGSRPPAPSSGARPPPASPATAHAYNPFGHL